MWRRARNDDIVHIYSGTDTGPVDGEIAQAQLNPSSFAQFGVRDAQQVLPERMVLQERDRSDQQQNNQTQQTANSPCHDSFPIASWWRRWRRSFVIIRR